MKTLKMTALMLVVAFTISTSFSQTQYALNTVNVEDSSPSIDAKTMAPSYVGGNFALSEFMKENLVYPELSKRQGMEGTVILNFIIKKNGSIEDITVKKSVTLELDNEAKRLVKKMPKWRPAMEKGQAKDIKYQLPVKFELTF